MRSVHCQDENSHGQPVADSVTGTSAEQHCFVLVSKLKLHQRRKSIMGCEFVSAHCLHKGQQLARSPSKTSITELLFPIRGGLTRPKPYLKSSIPKESHRCLPCRGCKNRQIFLEPPSVYDNPPQRNPKSNKAITKQDAGDDRTASTPKELKLPKLIKYPHS